MSSQSKLADLEAVVNPTDAQREEISKLRVITEFQGALGAPSFTPQRFDSCSVSRWVMDAGAGTSILDKKNLYNLYLVNGETTGRIGYGNHPEAGPFLEIFGEVYGESTPLTREVYWPLNGTTVFANQGIMKGNGFTFEAWIQPANLSQGGPARIIDIVSPNNDGTITRNAMLGQHGSQMRGRCRTSNTNQGGSPDTIRSGLTTGIQHVVFTVTANGTRTLYVSPYQGDFDTSPTVDTNSLGSMVPQSSLGYEIPVWDISYPVILFNTLDLESKQTDRHWEGKVWRVDVHDAALTVGQVEQNFIAGPTGLEVGEPPELSWETPSVDLPETTQLALSSGPSNYYALNLSKVSNNSFDVTLTLTPPGGGGTTGHLSLEGGVNTLTKVITIPGGATEYAVPVWVTDLAAVSDESWSLTIAPAPATLEYSVSNPTMVINVISDDVLPTVQFSVASSNFPALSDTSGYVWLTLDRKYSSDVSACVDISGGTTAASSFTISSICAIIGASSITSSICVSALSGLEGSTICLTLSSVSSLGSSAISLANSITPSGVSSHCITFSGSIPSGVTSGILSPSGDWPSLSSTGPYANYANGQDAGDSSAYGYDYPSNITPKPVLQDWQTAYGGQTSAAGDYGTRPGPTNTGPTTPGSLTPMGSITISTDGYVLSGVAISGRILVQANNVTISNFTVDGGDSASHGIKQDNGYTGMLVEDGEITRCLSSGLHGNNWTAIRLNIHEMGADATKSSGNTNLSHCWMHHLGKNVGSHADGIQTQGGFNIEVSANFFDMPIADGPNGPGAPYGSNACCIFQAKNVGPVGNVNVVGNWLNGGNYTVYFAGIDWPISDCTLINNRFGRDYRHGVLTTPGTNINTVVEGNVWDDTGLLMDINDSYPTPIIDQALVDASGAVFEDFTISGTLSIIPPIDQDIYIRNFIINAGGESVSGIKVGGDTYISNGLGFENNIIIEHGQVHNIGTSDTGGEGVAIYVDDNALRTRRTVLKNLNISGMTGDAIHPKTNCDIIHCWAHNFSGVAATQQSRAINMVAGSRGNVAILDTRVDMPYIPSGTAVNNIFQSTLFGSSSISNVRIEGNLFDGGMTTVNWDAVAGSTGQYLGTTFFNNMFGLNFKNNPVFVSPNITGFVPDMIRHSNFWASTGVTASLNYPLVLAGTPITNTGLDDGPYTLIVKPGPTNTGPWLMDTDGTTEIGTSQKYVSVFGGSRRAVQDFSGVITIDEDWIAADGSVDFTLGNSGSRILENFKAKVVIVEDLTSDFIVRNFLIDGGGVPEGEIGTLINTEHYLNDADEDAAIAGTTPYSTPQGGTASSGNATYGLYVRESLLGNLIVEHGEIRNCLAGSIYCIPNWYTGSVYEFGIDEFRATFRFLDLHDGGGDAFKCESRANVQWNWIHHFGRNPGAHADGIQTESGNSSTSGSRSGHILVEYNNFDMPVPESTNFIASLSGYQFHSVSAVSSLATQASGTPYASNAALIIQTTAGIVDYIVTKNWMNGGNYTIYWSSSGNDLTDCVYTDNRFGYDARFGMHSIDSANMVNFTSSGNVFDISGAFGGTNYDAGDPIP